MKKLLAFTLAILMTFGTTFVFAAESESDAVFTVYLGNAGDDGNSGTSKDSPVATLAKAIELIGTEREGVIKIVGDYDHTGNANDTAPRKHITVTGLDNTSRLIYSKTWGIGGDTTVENLIWRVNANSIYVLALGHTLEFGRGIVTEKSDNVGVYISIRGGGDTREINGDTNVILRSGTFSHIVGGTANRDVNGDTHITIYGGVFTGAIDGGNNSYLKDSPGAINGRTRIKIIGGDFTGCSRISGSDATDNAPVLYSRTLDLSDYDGTLPEGLIRNFDKVIYKKERKAYDIIPGVAYIKGYNDGTFKPQGNIKRSEAVAIITRLIADEESIKGVYTSTYSDVDSSAWYYDCVAFLEDAGYLTHFKDAFEPDKAITRAEFVAILANLGLGSYSNVDFTDVTDGHPLYNAIRQAASNGVVTGYPDGTFRPEKNITRAEAVTVVNLFIGRKEASDAGVSFSDCASHWAKGQIEAAAFPQKAGEEVTAESELKKLSTAKEFFEYAKNAEGTDKTVYAAEYAKTALRKSISDSKSEYTVGEGGTTYYVSPKGDDKNDGKSPETAWKTIARASREDGTLQPGDVVLFERGAEYRGQKLWTKPGVTYSAYGEGAKPVFNRSPEDGADESKWSLVEGTDNIYTYSGNIPDCGTLVFDGGEKCAVKDLPNWNGTDYVVRNGSGKYDPKTRLTSDLMFVQLDYTKGGGAVNDMNNYGKIYLRCDKGNPGVVFKSIEFTVRDHAVAAMRGVTIDNIRIINAGAHGVSAGNCTGLTVRNCEFEWIGGGIQGHTNGYAVRYGNAVEIWGKTEDYKVYNCSFNQIYDAAMTAQYKTTSTAEEDNKVALKNISFTGNVVTNTKYPIEIFLGINRQDTEYAIENLIAEYNFIIDIGYGLCEQAIDGTTPAALKSVGDRNPAKNYIFRNNLMLRSSRNLFEINAAYPEWYATLSGNIYAQKEGGYLGRYGSAQLSFYEDAEDLIKNTCLDKDAKVFYVK